MRVTVAIPAYNEVTNLERVVDESLREIERATTDGDAEVLVVDDGSRDGTSALADELARRHPSVRVFHHGTNRGFSGAMTTCFRESRGDWIFLIPADGQTRPAELPRFLEKASDADIVVGIRGSRADHAGRKVLSRGFHFIARSLLGIRLREFSSVFLFRRALLDAMPFRSRPNGATLLPEILFRADQRGARFATVTVAQFARLSGEPKGGRPMVAIVSLIELFRLAVLVRMDELRKVRRAEV
ncbi:MAG TPA: glycosyltransferase family 2 protein [Candidatus Limnocylindria bacterium]